MISSENFFKVNLILLKRDIKIKFTKEYSSIELKQYSLELEKIINIFFLNIQLILSIMLLMLY